MEQPANERVTLRWPKKNGYDQWFAAKVGKEEREKGTAPEAAHARLKDTYVPAYLGDVERFFWPAFLGEAVPPVDGPVVEFEDDEPVLLAVQPFVVETTGTGDALEVRGASMPLEQLKPLLQASPGFIWARNQDGDVVEMVLDANDALTARAVEVLENGGVRYLDHGGAPAP